MHADFSPLDSIHARHAIIRDRIRSVASGRSNGFYLHGRAGTSKTYLVRTTLDALAQPHVYTNGHLTARGLFELLQQHPSAVIVIDDVTTLFKDKLALQILLAALGNQPCGCSVRPVRYGKAGSEELVEFTGTIIAISNQPLSQHGDHVVRALGDRIHVQEYNPTDTEIEAQIYEIADTGPHGLDAAEARKVADFLLQDCRHLGIHPSIRLFVDKAIPDYIQWKSEESESSWHDLIHSDVLGSVIVPKMKLRDMSRRDQITAERQIAAYVHSTTSTREDRALEWMIYTGKSESSLYRRLAEIGEVDEATPPPPPAA